MKQNTTSKSFVTNVLKKVRQNVNIVADRYNYQTFKLDMNITTNALYKAEQLKILQKTIKRKKYDRYYNYYFFIPFWGSINFRYFITYINNDYK